MKVHRAKRWIAAAAKLFVREIVDWLAQMTDGQTNGLSKLNFRLARKEKQIWSVNVSKRYASRVQIQGELVSLMKM